MNPTAVRAIYVLTTGGTIEKVYSEQTGAVQNLDSKIDRYLSRLRLSDCDVNVVPLMNKDSLEMTDQDRLVLVGMVRAILKDNTPIVITHGTDTMVETALYLQQVLEAPVMPIVLTGAMIPLGFEGSDAYRI
jgi:L-asparaginase